MKNKKNNSVAFSSNFDFASICFDSGNYFEAEKILKDIAYTKKLNKGAIVKLANLYIHTGRLQDARDILWDVKDCHNHILEQRCITLAKIDKLEKNFKSTIKKCDESSSYKSKNFVIDAYLLKGSAFYSLGDLNNALSCFNAALLLDPQNPAALSNLIRTSIDIGNIDHAINLISNAPLSNPYFVKELNYFKYYISEILKFSDLSYSSTYDINVSKSSDDSELISHISKHFVYDPQLKSNFFENLDIDEFLFYIRSVINKCPKEKIFDINSYLVFFDKPVGVVNFVETNYANVYTTFDDSKKILTAFPVDLSSKCKYQKK